MKTIALKTLLFRFFLLLKNTLKKKLCLGAYRHEFGSTLFFDGEQDDPDTIGSYLEKTELKLTMTEVHLSNKRVEVSEEPSQNSGEIILLIAT